MNVGGTDQSIQLHTHRGAYDTLSRFAFFTMVSWQSWDTSLTLTKIQGSSQWSFRGSESRSHGELLHCMIIKYSDGDGTYIPFMFCLLQFQSYETQLCLKPMACTCSLCILLEHMHVLWNTVCSFFPWQHQYNWGVLHYFFETCYQTQHDIIRKPWKFMTD